MHVRGQAGDDVVGALVAEGGQAHVHEARGAAGHVVTIKLGGRTVLGEATSPGGRTRRLTPGRLPSGT